MKTDEVKEVEKIPMTIVQVVKSFRRTVSDKDYGSAHAAMELTADVKITSFEDLLAVNEKLAKSARILVTRDLKAFFQLKKDNKVI